MSTIKELRERQEKLVADARELYDSVTDDTPEAEAREKEAKYDSLMAEWDRLEARAKREEMLAEREARMNQPDPRRPKGEDREIDPAQESRGEVTHEVAFRSFLRYGMEGLTPEERGVMRKYRARDVEERAQATSPGSAGGHLVPQGFIDELVRSLRMWGPMLDPGVTRELVTGAGNQIDWPTMDDTSNKGAILAENTQDSEQDIAFGQKQLDAYKYTSRIIRVSEELLQDSAVDVEAIVRDASAERVGRIVNEHLTTGTGSGQPNGIVTASTEGHEAAAAAAITFDDLIELHHSVDPAYREGPSVRWMFNDGTLKLLRKIKDQDDRYIWQPADVRTGAPATILDKPYSVNQDMPDVEASAKSVLFGAFDRYVVRRVREFTMKRLVERYADFHQVGFIGFGRFDGELLDTAAVKHLAHPAT